MWANIQFAHIVYMKTIMKKHIFTFILSLVILLCVAVPCFADEAAQPSQQIQTAAFTDVPQGTVLEAVLSKLKNAGIINGYEDGSFRPNGNLTRAEFCKMTNKLFGYTSKAQTGFPDVSEENWFYEDVLIAKNYGYIKGFEDGTFRGNELLTRQQVCVILDRINGFYKLYDVVITDEVGEWAFESVEKVVSNGLMLLEEGNTFRATQPITRQEFAYVFVPFVDAIANSEGMFVPGSMAPVDPSDPSVDDIAISELERLVQELDSKKRFSHPDEFVPFYNRVKAVLRSIIADSESRIITQGYVSSAYGDEMRAIKNEYYSLCNDCVAEFNSIVISCASNYKAVLVEYFYDLLPEEAFDILAGM